MKCAYLAFLGMGLMACHATLDVGYDRRDGGDAPGDDSSPDPVGDAGPDGGGGSSTDRRDASTPQPGDPNNGPAPVGDASAGGDAGEPHGTPGPPNAKRMFVTRAEYPGDFAKHGTGTDPGADGADKLCAAAAASANLGGAWKAWISTTTNGSVPVAHHAIDRIAEVAGGWYNVDRTAWLFKNKANLATVPDESEWASAAVSLVKDEYGHRARFDTMVWTGTGTGGQLVVNRTCQSWTVASELAATGGYAAGNGSGWTAGAVMSCSAPAHFYCFEQ